MLTVAKLRTWGANVDEGLGRCLNNEAFYLKLVGKGLENPSFERLKETCEAGDYDQAFDAAHSLKGMLANLALTPILRPVEQITELLRAKTSMDYAPLTGEILSARDQLISLSESAD